MPFSTTYANEILNYTIAKTNALTAPSKVYIGLSSNDPEADNGTFTELQGGNYNRVLVSIKGESFPDYLSSASNREIGNVKQINWLKSTSAWPTAKGFGLFSAETGGTPFFYGKLDEPVEVPSGAVALFDPGTLKISFPATDITT